MKISKIQLYWSIMMMRNKPKEPSQWLSIAKPCEWLSFKENYEK